jgi:hypothetical protein
MPLLRKAPSAMKGLFGFIPLPYSKESRIKDRSDSSAVCSPRSRSPTHSELYWVFLFIPQPQKDCKFQSRDQFLALTLLLTLVF